MLWYDDLLVAQSRSQCFTGFLGIAKEDIGVGLEQDRVHHTRVSCVTNRSLEHVNLFALPHTKDRHTINTAIWIVLRGATDSVRSW